MLTISQFILLSLYPSPLVFFLKIFYLSIELGAWSAEREGIPDSLRLGIFGKVLVLIQQFTQSMQSLRLLEMFQSPT